MYKSKYLKLKKFYLSLSRGGASKVELFNELLDKNIIIKGRFACDICNTNTSEYTYSIDNLLSYEKKNKESVDDVYFKEIMSNFENILYRVKDNFDFCRSCLKKYNINSLNELNEQKCMILDIVNNVEKNINETMLKKKKEIFEFLNIETSLISTTSSMKPLYEIKVNSEGPYSDAIMNNFEDLIKYYERIPDIEMSIQFVRLVNKILTKPHSMQIFKKIGDEKLLIDTNEPNKMCTNCNQNEATKFMKSGVFTKRVITERYGLGAWCNKCYDVFPELEKKLKKKIVDNSASKTELIQKIVDHCDDTTSMETKNESLDNVIFIYGDEIHDIIKGVYGTIISYSMLTDLLKKENKTILECMVDPYKIGETVRILMFRLELEYIESQKMISIVQQYDSDASIVNESEFFTSEIDSLYYNIHLSELIRVRQRILGDKKGYNIRNIRNIARNYKNTKKYTPILLNKYYKAGIITEKEKLKKKKIWDNNREKKAL